MVGVTLAVLDGTIANVALPTIASDFHASPSISIWIVNGYQLAIVTTLLPFAALGEIHGYRRVYLWGIALFTLASVGCMLSDSLTALTGFRILQGFGAAGLMSVNTALLRYTVAREKFGVALGINALVVAAAATIGPSLGGFILSALNWPWLFAINLPLGVLAIVLGIPSLPGSDLADRRFDWLSALLSAATIGLVITIIDSIGHELPWWSIAAQAAGCLIAAVFLVRRELLRIATALKKVGLTVLMTAERDSEYGEISRHRVEEFVADNVVILRNALDRERRRRPIEVLKMRSSSPAAGG
ncbi:MAG: MFS transporter [Rhizobiales bacterium]|nr:MFS transporter [Hyphomicrobiales bacterium]